MICLLSRGAIKDETNSGIAADRTAGYSLTRAIFCTRTLGLAVLGWAGESVSVGDLRDSRSPEKLAVGPSYFETSIPSSLHILMRNGVR
jgi:hypothetical protein